MKKIEWSSKYETGNQIIDNQHRGLIDLINDLTLYATQMKTGNKQHIKEIDDMISDLSLYCKNHFETEETLMKNL